MMRYDDEKYLDNEEDNDLWDDELEIFTDDSSSRNDYLSGENFTPHDSYSQYETEYQDDDNFIPDEDQNEEDISVSTDRELKKERDPDDYYSDPEIETHQTEKPKKERFFKKKVDDDDNDYFDSDDEPAPIKEPKAPKLNPEDPDYWIEDEESPFESIIHKPRRLWKWWLAGALTLLALVLFCWIWFLRPYTDNAVKYCYIINMERRGSIFKTFEGTMIPYKELGDPNPLSFDKVNFSVEGDSLAAVMKRMMLRSVPARIEYKMYHAPLPWIGDEKMIIIKADSTDPRKILPPEYR